MLILHKTGKLVPNVLPLNLACVWSKIWLIMNGITSDEDDEHDRHRFLFVSKEGIAGDLAWTVLKEGHNVRLFVESKSYADVYEGFVEKVKNWEDHIEWADVIVFDHIGYGFHAESLRGRGKLVIGGTMYTDRLEDDRSFGQEELRRHGVKILKYNNFDNFDDAIEHVQRNPGKYVIKPSGEVQDQKQLLFVGNEEDGSDVVRVLSAYKRTWGEDIHTFQLQKKASGVEIAVGCFFNGHTFLMPININFEHKKLFPGELGVSTGEMGTSMYWDLKNPVFDATLKKMEATLGEHGYVGYIDINCIVNGNGIYPLEFTCRFGHPLLDIQQDAIMIPKGQFLYALASGKDFVIRTHQGFQVGVLVVVPPFPYHDMKTFNTFSLDAVIVFKKPMKEGVHIQDLKCVNGEWLIAGSSGIALLITGIGQTMKEAQNKMYSRVQNILINNMYYRTDIGDRWASDSDKLQSWDYL